MRVYLFYHFLYIPVYLKYDRKVHQILYCISSEKMLHVNIFITLETFFSHVIIYVAIYTMFTPAVKNYYWNMVSFNFSFRLVMYNYKVATFEGNINITIILHYYIYIIGNVMTSLTLWNNDRIQTKHLHALLSFVDKTIARHNLVHKPLKSHTSCMKTMFGSFIILLHNVGEVRTMIRPVDRHFFRSYLTYPYLKS